MIINRNIARLTELIHGHRAPRRFSRNGSIHGGIVVH